VKLNPKH